MPSPLSTSLMRCVITLPSLRNMLIDFILNTRKALESPDLTPRVRRKCLKLLYKACTDHALLPKSLQMHFSGNPTGFALYRGGFGDVWKREYRGQEVAVKVVRTYADSDLKKVSRVSDAPNSDFNPFTDILTVNRAEVLQRVRNVENSPSSERAAAARSCNVGDSVCDGVGVDA